MKLDRVLQNKILNLAADSYPSYISPGHDNDLDSYNEMSLAANLKYLEEHRLIRPNSVTISIDNFYSFGPIEITKNGLDFLLGDEGLSAILNVVTVKFEADTLKAILENRINQSDLAPERKQSMIDSLRELPAESIKHLTMKLLDEGLENLPSAILLIGTYLGMS
ncbi:hypothetical protein [Acinetobacter haemolyticus]|uniref:hypothetical protein n=1 Tax=Acinetobacter haemolyticus TaxID=29430 RepID=UPI00325BEF8C